MQNEIDFIYEYSDLRFMYNRAKVLTGEYVGMILEFGGSGLTLSTDETPKFDFEYTIFVAPDNITHIDTKFLSELLIAIIVDRRTNPDEKQRYDEAIAEKNTAKIVIPPHFYKDKTVVV